MRVMIKKKKEKKRRDESESLPLRNSKGTTQAQSLSRIFEWTKRWLADFQMDDSDMEESVGSEQSHLDRLSELPDSLIHHILSFLPMRDVVSTTLLSKRWEDLWTTLPCLNFSDIISGYKLNSPRLRNFINGALMFWKGTKLLKFIIDIEVDFDKSLIGDMNLWVRYAVKNKVQELNIILINDLRGVGSVCVVPQCLNKCSSMTKLSLVGCNLRIHASPAWDQLKSLRIDTFCSSEDLINQILLGSPQLEEFELAFLENNENLNIWSTSLKKLKIIKYKSNVEPSLDKILTINCPNLETLEISVALFYKCLFTNFSSLTDATLNFDDFRYKRNSRGAELLGETMRHVFLNFQHVERLTLSYGSYQVLEASMKENLFSPLPNVVFLKLAALSSQLVGIVDLLEIFPNLKKLVFKDCVRWIHSEFETGLSKSVLLQLKIIEITSDFYDSSSIFRFIEFFLKHCSMLEKMVVRVHCDTSYKPEQLLEITERLLNMPRSSPTAKVIFYKK